MTNTVSESTILPISEIAILFDVNIRELDTDYVSELMHAQFEYGESHWQTHWKEKPKINQDGILFSGFHTITAAKRNFGNDHEVSFQVVEGDPYLLAACENAVHGKRRTNADKRAAVLRWLQDDEGRQWTGSHIAKQCHVSDSLVNSVDVSLQENGSDTYERPTKRKYIDKHGTVTWMETAKINDATGESQVSVISSEKTAGEVLEAQKAKASKDVLKEQEHARLTEARIHANKALDKMWENFHASELTNCVEPDAFVKAACKHHRNWGVDDIPEMEDTDIPNIWEARFNLLTTQIQTRSIWITEFISRITEEGTDPDSKLLRAQARAQERRQRMWSYFASEIQIKYGKTIQEVSEEDFAKAAAVALGLDTIRAIKVGLEGMECCFGADAFILDDIENPPYSLSDCSLADATMWASRFDLIAIALMNMADWVKTLLEARKAKAREQVNTEPETPSSLSEHVIQLVDQLFVKMDELGIDESRQRVYLMEKAAKHYSFSIDTLEILTDGSETDHQDFFANCAPPHIETWRNTLTSMINDLEHGRNWAPSREPRNTEEVPAEDGFPDMNALWDAFNKRYPKWKAKYAESGYKENDLIQASTEAEMLDALRVYRETERSREDTGKSLRPSGHKDTSASLSERKGMPTADEVKDMTDLMSQQSYPFARCLRDLLRAKGISDWTQQHQQTLESVQKFKERLREFGAPDDLVDDSLHFYQGIEEAKLSTSPQETLKQLNEFLQDFIDKPLPEWPEWIRHQVPEGDEEGFPGIDIHAMRNTLSSLLQSLGIDDTHRGLQESLGGDLLDVFLQYEELPTEKEQLIALLNTADALLSEMIP